jgi:hypothetical protein
LILKKILPILIKINYKNKIIIKFSSIKKKYILKSEKNIKKIMYFSSRKNIKIILKKRKILENNKILIGFFFIYIYIFKKIKI